MKEIAILPDDLHPIVGELTIDMVGNPQTCPYYQRFAVTEKGNKTWEFQISCYATVTYFSSRANNEFLRGMKNAGVAGVPECDMEFVPLDEEDHRKQPFTIAQIQELSLKLIRRIKNAAAEVELMQKIHDSMKDANGTFKLVLVQKV